MARNAARSRLPTDLGSVSQRLRIASESAGRPRRQSLPGNRPGLTRRPADISHYPQPDALQGRPAGGRAMSGEGEPHTARYGPGAPGGSPGGPPAGEPALCSPVSCLRYGRLRERPAASCARGCCFRPGPPACPASSPFAGQERCAAPAAASYSVVTGRTAGEPGVAAGTCHPMSAGPVSPAGLRGRRAITLSGAARPPGLGLQDGSGDAAGQEGT
jgi:hypothetical protein